jgi:ribosomal protein S18 acetylase RimI-like enzyme
MPQVEVVRTSLEMRDPAALVTVVSPDPRARVERLEQCPPSFFAYLYAEVGRNYHWVDRLSWTREEVRTYLAHPTVSLWLLTVTGSPAGYFELKRHDDGSTEIVSLGLLPEFLGRGLGKHLLATATREAWNSGANRVWLHTCTLDDPAALPNYTARGFRVYKTETYFTDIRRPGEPG